MMDSKHRDVVLWISVLTGPILWLMSFGAKFAWVPVACATQTRFVLLGMFASAFLLTAASGVLGWRQWRELRKSTDIDGAEPLARSRFMAIGGVVLSAGFCVVLSAQALPDLAFGVCQ